MIELALLDNHVMIIAEGILQAMNHRRCEMLGQAPVLLNGFNLEDQPLIGLSKSLVDKILEGILVLHQYHLATCDEVSLSNGGQDLQEASVDQLIAGLVRSMSISDC